MPRHLARPDGRLRPGLLALAGLGIAGTAAELGIERHWDSFEQLIPWAALLVAALALIGLVFRASTLALWLARIVAVALVAIATVGIWRHIHANFETAPLDFRYSERWETMSFFDQLRAAAGGAVGPAPVLASGILAQVGLALGLATIGLPASGAGGDASA